MDQCINSRHLFSPLPGSCGLFLNLPSPAFFWILPLLYHRNYGHCFNICLRFLKEKRQKSGGMVSAPSAITCARCINHPYSLEIMPNASAMSRLQPSTLTVSSPKMPNALPVVFLSMMEFSSSSVRPEASMTAPTCTLAP